MRASKAISEDAEPVDQLQIALLVQVHDGQGRPQLAALRRFFAQARGQAVGVQPGDDRRRLGVVQAGHAVEDLLGIVGALAADHEDGEPVLCELVAEDVAVGARRLHDDLDLEACGPEATQDAQHRGVLGRGFPADGLQHATVGGGHRRDHVHLGDIHGEDQAPAELGR